MRVLLVVIIIPSKSKVILEQKSSRGKSSTFLTIQTFFPLELFSSTPQKYWLKKFWLKQIRVGTPHNIRGGHSTYLIDEGTIGWGHCTTMKKRRLGL